MPSSWQIDIAGQPGMPGGPQGGIGPVGPGYQATSTTNFAIGTGSMMFATQPGLAYTIGARVRVASHADPTQWMEGVCTAYDPVVGSLTLNVDLNNQIASSFGASAPILVPGAGRLTYVNATTLKFAPYNGDIIKINGILYQIPGAGIVGLTTTGVFVNGVASQNLVATTLYYVYCFNNGGVLTADFSTTGYVNSTTTGNVGTFIKSGDNTRSLIGMVYLSGSPVNFFDQLAGRWVRSWFNPTTALLSVSAPASLGVTSGGWVGSTGVLQAVVFAGESVCMRFTGSVYFPSANTIYQTLFMDGAGWGGGATFTSNATWGSFAMEVVSNVLSEGFHNWQAMYQSAVATSNMGGILNGTVSR
jgi:hypothetical protein